MKIDASQPSQEIKSTTEAVLPSEYLLMTKMADWANSHIEHTLSPEIMGSAEAPELIAEEISKLIPIDKGYGQATISEQLNYYNSHQDKFETFRDRRELAAKLVEERDVIATNKRSLENQIKEIRVQLIGLPNNIADLDETELNTALELLGGDLEDRVIIQDLLADLKKLPSEIEAAKIDLESTQSQFDRDHRLLTELTSNLDCKLPAMICGSILQKLGWELSLVSVDHPEHPSILCTKGEDTYMISFDSEFNKFKSLAKFEKYNSRQRDRIVTYSRSKAAEVGFISDITEWPLPFSVEGFRKFDNWFIDKVRSKK